MIDSLDNKFVKHYKQIRNKKYINEYGEYIVEGEHLVREAIKSGNVKEIILLDGYDYETTLNKVIVSERVMKSISLLMSVPYVMAVVKVNSNNKITGKRIVLLDGVQDPGNVGTIIRNSLAFDIDTLVLSETCASIYNDKVIRSTQGMMFHMNIVTMDLIIAIEEIKKMGIKVYSTSLDSSKFIDDVKFGNSYAIVFGSEGNGVSKEVLNISDELIKIPMNNNCESLNVAVSSGIILYELRK